MRVLVGGAGGAIGGHLVRRLLDEGHEVRAVDIKIDDWWQQHDDAENVVADLSTWEACLDATRDVDHVYSLACDMGGVGWLVNNRALASMSVLITTHMLKASVENSVQRFFQSSSACAYSILKQQQSDSPALCETDAYPAAPEPGYGEEKWYGEQMCRYVREDLGLETRVARFHNVFGTYGSWTGGREKAPAAICRKIAEAIISGEHKIELFGDGSQTRSFMAMEDCVKGVRMIMDSDFADPLNLGSSELVSVNQLVDIVEDIAGVALERTYDLGAPQGVRGRNSDNTLIQQTLGWQPSTPLRDGLAVLYPWIFEQVNGRLLTATSLTCS